MKKWSRLGIGSCVAVALCASLGATSAYAVRIVNVGGDGADWTVPTSPTTNTVWKDAEGNVVAADTEGATQYKVVTTWAEAWSTCGADFLGLANSAFYGNGGNGNATVITYDAAAKSTTVGVWATDANVNPNAYNYNTFYNLYARTQGWDAETYSDWACVTSGSNKSPDGGADWATDAGVWCGFKYRPDVVTTNNNLSASAAATYISQIQKGQYSSTYTTQTEGRSKTYYPTANEDGTYDSSFALYGDSNYNPVVMGFNNNSAYSFGGSLYELAADAEAVIAATAKNPGLSEGETLTWKTAQELPRASRYTETPTECATNFEKLTKGSIYYVLEQINKGTVEKKKVALVNTNPGSTGVADGTAIVAAYDYIDGIGGGATDGLSGIMPVAVDQLTTGTPSGTKQGSSSVASTDSSTNTYQLYVATADELAQCDVIYAPQLTSMDAAAWQTWIETNATTQELKDKAKDITYIVDGMPCATGGSNFTIEKTMYGIYALDCIYPELFPNMQLSSYWCDAIYHLKTTTSSTSETSQSVLTQAMSWIYASAPLPAGTDLNALASDYSRDNVEAKFAEGLNYYLSNKTTDPTISRVLANVGLDGSTGWNGNDYSFGGFAPTDTWLNAREGFSITTQPTDAALEAVGDTISFTVATDDAAATYQWKYSTDGGSTWKTSGLSSAKTSTLSVKTTAANVNRKYYCVVTFSDGTTAASNVVGVASDAAAGIATQPVNVSGTIGEAAYLTLEANSVASYQWQYSSNNGKTWANSGCAGNNTDTLKVTPTEATANRAYRCIVTCTNGKVETSDTVYINLSETYAITAQPTTAAVSLGEKAVFSLTAENAVSYQWQYSSNDGETWAKSGCAGNATSTLKVTTTEANQNRSYRCIVTFRDGTTETSEAIQAIIA